MQGRAPAVGGPAHPQIAEVDRECVLDDGHPHPMTRAIHDLEAADIVVAVQQRHHAEIAVRAGPQLPRQRRFSRRRVMHDAQLADVPVDLIVEKLRRQVESLREDMAQEAGDPLKFVPVGLQREP